MQFRVIASSNRCKRKGFIDRDANDTIRSTLPHMMTSRDGHGLTMCRSSVSDEVLAFSNDFAFCQLFVNRLCAYADHLKPRAKHAGEMIPETGIKDAGDSRILRGPDSLPDPLLHTKRSNGHALLPPGIRHDAIRSPRIR